MTTSYKGYVDLSYKPGKGDLVADFFLEPNAKVPFEEAAQAVAAESSIGTWTELSTLTQDILKRLRPKIFELDEKKGTAKIAYPIDLFEAGNISQIMSSVAGNVFGMKEVDSLRLNDLIFPEKIVKEYKGPEFGIEGIRKIVGVKGRPLVGTIIKPKLGLNAKEHAKVAYNAWLGGLDIVKDDENLSSMAFNNFRERMNETFRLRDKCEGETGEKKIYMPNVSSPFKEMVKRAQLVKEKGGEYAMVDVLTVGWGALQELRNENLKLVFHAHRAGHAAFTRNPKHGISMLVIARLCRMIGMDQLHIGAIFGKMEGGKEEVQEIDNALKQDWFGLKKTLSVCSGGLHPGHVPSLVKALGKDIVIQMGGGVHGHPQGTIAGAKAARQALEAAVQGIELKQYAKTHKELEAALEKWVA
ncbi:MAG: type III ribulose-bisphosphate carboxylase [Candidatus Diapherotrites archaeon]